MAAKKDTKSKKQVTEIEDAKVKIEVEEIEENDKKDDAEVEEEVEEVEESEETPEEDIEDVEEKKEDSYDDWDEESGGRFSWKKVFIFTLLAALIGTLVVGGFLFFNSGYKISVEKVGQETEKNIEIPEVTPTPTEAPVSKEDYDITVLNGSGIEGEAATVQELLEDDGFVVVEIGNADSATYLDTQILAGDDVDEEYLDMLLEALEERGPTEIEEAPVDQTEEVVVIVGSELTDESADLDLE